jgi:dihydroorotate dehydrogenase (fumarate)
MDLSTRYLGLTLPHPLMPGASPLVDDLDLVQRLAEAGAPAIVMHSLFEEQLRRDRARTLDDLEAHSDSFAEAATFLPRPASFALGPDAYLEQIRRIRTATGLPVIASLNGTTPTGWLDYAELIEQAGAAALELNVYRVVTDPDESAADVEGRIVEMVRAVRPRIRIPLSVKLSPFFSSLPHLVHRLEVVGADGVVLFNRFYQPDIDPEALEIVPRLELSRSSELRLRLRWLAILSGRAQLSLAASGGVHTAEDALKAVMAGAHAVQIVSALLAHGPEQLAILRAQLAAWLEAHEYQSLAQAQGSMSLQRCPNPDALERANYMRVLQSWKRVGW